MNGLIRFNWNKLFKMYFQMDVSEQFLNCLNIQLTDQFKKATGINTDDKIHLSWKQGEPPALKVGPVSTIAASLMFKYGSVDINICWSSKSGRIYELDDKDVDCADIDFWFEELEIDKWKKLHKPDFSKFFTFYERFANYAKKTYNIDMSDAYVLCMRQHLSLDFEFKTGLKINKDINIQYITDRYFYTKGEVSTTQATIYVNHNWNSNVEICWKSKSGRIYEMTDEDIDCDDIVMWFNGLEPELYHRQLYPKDPLPFKLKNLTYRLQVNRIQTDCQMVLTIKNDKSGQKDVILKGIYDFIDSYNTESEEKKRQMGVVHNTAGSIEDHKITLDIDVGSAGADFFKKLLRYFSKLDAFELVVID